jgi:hypothetical protein
MKKIILLCVLLVGCAPVGSTSMEVQVPEAVTVGIGGLLVALFTMERTGLDLRYASVPLAATLSVWIVGELQQWIDVIPPVHDPTIRMVLTIIGIVLAGFGTLRMLSRQPASLIPGGFQSRANVRH